MRLSVTYLRYGRTGQELRIADDLRLIGCDVWCGRKMVWKRSGKQRKPEGQEETALPNYILATMTADQFHKAKDIKGLHATAYAMTYRGVARFKRFAREVDKAFLSDCKARDRLEVPRAQFDPGQLLEATGGPLVGQMMKFRRIVEGASELELKLEVQTNGPFGRVLVDPLDVRRA